MIRQRTYDEIRQSIRNNINDKDERIDSKPGTFVSDAFVCPQADQLAAYYIDLKLMELNQSILTATNYDLDRLGYNYFTYRKGAAKAYGRVRFYIQNTNRTTLSFDSLPTEVYIPIGYQVATQSNTTTDSIIFTTTESAIASNRDIYNSLPTDVSNGFKYLECEVECDVVGERGNVDAGLITQPYSESIDGIVMLSNPFACSGGEDQESDVSLRMRIMLSVLGASICTKNGYLKFVIQKDYVEDAVVIGGGDNIMFRDGGYLDAAGDYIYGRGGMVDIWIRGKQLQELTKTFTMSSTYIRNLSDPTPDTDIILDYQPVVNIVSITSSANGYIYENAENYEIEYGVSNNAVTETYYRDFLWDFSVTDSFTDTDYYPMDLIDDTEIEVLRKQVNKELEDALEYMENIDYTINWNLVTLEDITSATVTPMFRKVFYNGKTYKIIAVDRRLNGRTFVKKRNRIYLRVYQEPDYAMVPTIYSDEKYTSQMGNDIGGSIISTDRVHWTETGKKKLQEGDSLIIRYNFNQLILSLQNDINAKRILTADILMRQAIAVPLQIILEAQCDSNYDSSVLRNTIMTAISAFVNDLKTMGASIEDSELVTIARSVEGITHVDLDSVSLSRKHRTAESIIKIAKNEYFTLDDLQVTVTSNNTIDGSEATYTTVNF